MAELGLQPVRWQARQTRAQWAAIAWLRWRVFRNGLSRKGATGELVGSLLLLPLFAIVFTLPVLGAGARAFYLAHSGQLERMAWLLWGVFLLAQLVNINLGQPGTTFDPSQLIRFPLPLRQFVLLRLFFGLLSPANVLVSFMGCSMALGLSVALPRLWLPLTAALLVFTAVNVLFTRMVFAWVDRWLSTRRAREVFTAILFLGSLGVQYVNISLNSGYARRHPHSGNVERWRALGRAYDHMEPVLTVLPPELTASSLRSAEQGRSFAFARQVAGCALFGLLFGSIFALRMRTEFRGEALSDQAQGSAAPVKSRGASSSGRIASEGISASSLSSPGAVTRGLSPAVRAVLGKEILYMRRNMGIFYSLIAPVAMVFLFAGRMATRNSTPWVFPAALAYTLIGVMPLSFNSFGLESTGAQFYFLAPVRLREVMLGKNLLGFGLAALEALVTLLVITFTVGTPSAATLFPCLLWAAATLLLGTSLGNRRALSAPKQIKFGKSGGKQVSPLSALMSFGILLLSTAVGACLLVIARSFHLPWLPLLAFATLFGISLLVYVSSLAGLDRYALSHREELFAELCKA